MTTKEKLFELSKYYKSRRDLAEKLNCTEASINRWLNGKNISRVFESAIKNLHAKMQKA